MNQSNSTLLDQALALPVDERAALAQALIDSLDDARPGATGAWLSEAQDRLAAFRAGELDAIAADQVFADLATPAR
jgi:putative addiction module component (TIGR02574 family)